MTAHIKVHSAVSELRTVCDLDSRKRQRLTPDHRLAYGLAERLHTSESSGRSRPVDLYHTVCDCQGISLGILPGQVGAEHNGIGPRHLGGDLQLQAGESADIFRQQFSILFLLLIALAISDFSCGQQLESFGSGRHVDFARQRHHTVVGSLHGRQLTSGHCCAGNQSDKKFIHKHKKTVIRFFHCQS